MSASASRRIWLLAWPLILSNITVPLLGLADTAVMGHLPDPRYLAAVTLGATLFSFLYWGFSFLRMGTTGMAAQAHGRDDADALRTLLAQGLVLAAGLGLAVMALRPVLVSLGLEMLQAPEPAAGLAAEYAAWRVLSAPAVLGNYVLLGWFLGLHRSRVTLYLMVLNNSVNIALDLVFVLGLGMTVAGVALASVIGDYLAFATGLWLAGRALARLGGRLAPGALTRWASYQPLLEVNGALFLRTLLVLFAMAFFTAQGARQGAEVLAANAVLMQLVLLTSFGLDGFAHATEAVTGEAVARGDRTGFRHSLRAAALWSLGTAASFSLVFALAGNAIVAGLTGLPEVRGLAGSYLPWLVAMPLVAVWSYLLDGAFIGATRTREMRDSMLVSVALVYLPAWYLARPLGNHGLWLAFLLFNASRGLTLGWVLWRLTRAGFWLGSAPRRAARY